MKILIIGKYPPIEGGVSSRTYWLARALAERGHQVAVVTNASRVESEYRIAFDTSASDFRTNYRPAGVTVYDLKNPSPRHIPYSEGYASRLANLALKAVAEHGADVIFSFYLEPYGVVGMMVKELTGIPLVIQHAGSDIYRILPSEDYRYLMGRVLKSADRIMLAPALSRVTRAAGIPRRLMVPLPSLGAPGAFSPEGARYAPFASSKAPKLLYFGKAGRNKGLAELLEALVLVKEACELHLFTDGDEREKLQRRIDATPELAGRVHIHDFVAPWLVPSVLRAGDVLVQLEHRFPIPIHSPVQPFEGVATGTPLLLSEEIFAKMKARFPETADKFVVVRDPLDAPALAKTISELLKNLTAHKQNARLIRDEFVAQNRWNEGVAHYERVLTDARGRGLGRFFRRR